MANRNRKTKQRAKYEPVAALVANDAGEIFDLPGYTACAMAGGRVWPLSGQDVIPMPRGSEVMYLPDRHPVLHETRTGEPVVLEENPYEPGEALRPVAVFNSPGYVLRGVCAYAEAANTGWLPLFSYGACGWQGDGMVSAAFRVDWSRRQDLALMPETKIGAGVKRLRKDLPDNRLARHLEKCALTYGCPAAKNMFVGREEAPLPTAPACNARCLGCLSLQKESDIPHSQDRIGFIPTPDEIAEVGLAHLARVPHNAVLSFGQGCEGDPLLAAGSIAPAIRLIRAETGAGTINLNTNGGRPDLLEQCLDAGLESIRVSMNSVREQPYMEYFRPKYDFSAVLESIDMAGARGAWVSVNYLNMPGFTDSLKEREALFGFLGSHHVDMIQWRCMNFDPLRYYAAMGLETDEQPLGMENLLREVRRLHPPLRFGYFNPPKETWAALPQKHFT
ncbi:MAG: radical SAM protein [Desulfatibacillaceae bacterium]